MRDGAGGEGVIGDDGLALATTSVLEAPLAWFARGASGPCRLDTVTKGRTIALTQKNFLVGPADRRYAETIYPMVQESIRERVFLPRRSSNLCFRKYCGYWRSCEREFGGTVREQ